MNEPPKQFRVERQVNFTCPFCGRRASFGYVQEHPTATHDMPMCKKFEELEPDEFLQAVNRKLAETAPS
jgi:hypothetical protein